MFVLIVLKWIVQISQTFLILCSFLHFIERLSREMCRVWRTIWSTIVSWPRCCPTKTINCVALVLAPKNAKMPFCTHCKQIFIVFICHYFRAIITFCNTHIIWFNNNKRDKNPMHWLFDYTYCNWREKKLWAKIFLEISIEKFLVRF